MADNIVITAELKDLVSGHLKDITAQVNKLEGSLSNVGKSSGGSGGSGGGGIMGSVLGANLLTGAISRVGGAVKDFAVGSAEAYMKNEMYEARLTTLLHGREQALKALKNITKDAALTPFDKESLVQGNSMLIGAGESAQGARKSIMDLGNAIAATGGGSDELSRMAVNLAQIKSIGKASALDVKQFMYANIPIYDMLAKSMHKTAKEVKGMDISYQDLTKALSDARKEGGMFQDGLENANKTLTGQVSNLGDAWDQLKTSIGNSQSGILKDTVSWANGMVAAMNKSFSRTESIDNAVKKYAPNQAKGGFAIKTDYHNALSDMVTNSVNGADTKENALKQQKFLQSLLKMKASEFAKEIPNAISRTLNGGADMNFQMNSKTVELSIIRGALSDVNSALKDFNKKPTKADGSEANNETQKASELEKVAKANRPTQINVNIENLVREINNTYQNTKSGMELTGEQIAKVLIGAVNDVSVTNFGN